MKKLLSLLLAFTMVLALAACGGSNDSGESKGSISESPTEDTAAAADDLSYVKDKGTLVVGITNFAPMDYKEENSDEWIGFDADMAKAFGKSLGVDVEFSEINWDNKIMELNNKSVDCLWNGMTLTDEVTSSMECSNPYYKNAQVVVLPSDKAGQYKDAESIADLSFAVESGSAGEDAAEANNLSCTPVTAQSDALMEVNAGTSDAAIIDLSMAKAMTGEGTDYADLTYTIELNSEEYGVGFRQGSGLAAELNQFFKDSYADGSMIECAEKYDIADLIIEQ